MLLTTVTNVDPLANSQTASVSTKVAATFDQNINAATATSQTFAVHSERSGQLVGAEVTVNTAGQTVTLDPTSNFFPGERVRVSATAGIQSTTADPNVPRVWEFRTAVNSGSGQFVNNGQTLGNHNTHGMAMGDLDGDGDLDVLQGNYNSQQLGDPNRVFLNDGNGNFTDSGQLLGNHNARDVGLGDLDGDGDLDYFSANYPTMPNRVFLNDGNGNFMDSGQLIGNANSWDVDLGDVDGDGDLDAYVGNGYSANQLYLNDGSGQFANSGQNMGTGSSQALKLGDLDGDGDLDAFVTNFGAGNRTWLNDGSGVFIDTGQSLGTNLDNEVRLGDMDGDGDLDAVDSSRVWLNDGAGVFTDSGQAVGGGGFDVGIGDVDGDGDLDIFYNSNVVFVLLNDGNGVFTDSGQSLATNNNSLGMELGDLDGDGDLDVYVGHGSQPDVVWINQNLNPSLTLTVDNPAIAEAAGVASVTATLSASHGQPVTVDLGFSGTATATADYTTSNTQIVIAAGETTGSITVTAVQDAVDEPNETVIVDITGVTNADEAGTQQASLTIVDDDDPIPVPDVTLSVDNASIPEAGGVATFTANLSVVTTVPVTIDLAISGSAAATDFSSSGTQIVVGPGATSGSITVTAVQDDVDEPDETVMVDVTSVTGGTESGVQQQTTTIADDDEPVVPDVTLSADPTEIAEAVGVSTLTVTLSEVTTIPVTVDLEFSGSAATTDYSASATQIVVAPGSSTGSATVAAVQDEVNEPDETVIVDISVTGGNEDGTQQQTITILDDDVPPSFAVTSLEATASGFRVEFTNQLDASGLNLYDTQNAGLGPADVVVTGAASGAVAGSLVIDTSAATFVKSGDPLAADTYTVTLRSASDGFKDVAAMLLDGNGDGTGGDDYVGDFTIAEASAGTRTISIPDFVRGPGQDVNLPADETTGIPITISDGDNVRAADVRVAYDPALLEITGATAPAGGSVIVNTTTTPGVAILVFFSSASLPAGSSTFINLQATAPTENASANYGGQQLLDLHSVTIGDGNDNEFPVVVDDALHFSSYFADVSGNGRVNASDAAQVARFAALIDGGFAASLNTDPVVVGDISGNGRINAADASRVAQFAALIAVPEIPPIPAGVAVSGVADLGPGLPDLRLPARQAAPSTSEAKAIQSSDGSLLPQEGPDPYQAVDTVMASIDLLDADHRLILALEDAIAELLSAELLTD